MNIILVSIFYRTTPFNSDWSCFSEVVCDLHFGDQETSSWTIDFRHRVYNGTFISSFTFSGARKFQ